MKEFNRLESIISNQMILNCGCMIKNNAESSMLVFTVDNKLKLDPVFLLSMFLQTGFN